MMVALVFWIACTRAVVAHAAIFIVCDVFKMCERRHLVMVKWKMKSWRVTRVIMWLLCDRGIEASKDWVFVTHFSPAQTYTPEPRCHTSYTGGLVWAVRLWISCCGATMCSKCLACMPVCKMYNPCTIHLTPQPCGKPPRSGSAVLLDKNDPVCFSILQK